MSEVSSELITILPVVELAGLIAPLNCLVILLEDNEPEALLDVVEKGSVNSQLPVLIAEKSTSIDKVKEQVTILPIF